MKYICQKCQKEYEAKNAETVVKNPWDAFVDDKNPEGAKLLENILICPDCKKPLVVKT